MESHAVLLIGGWRVIGGNVDRQSFYLTTEHLKALKKLAKTKGYVVPRGKGTGEGSVSKLLQALADGELTLVKLG